MRIGLLGAGRFGLFHLTGYKKNPNCTITAVASRTEKSANNAAKKFGIEKVYSGEGWKDMLRKENLDAVSICSPNYLHASMTLIALENNCNVLCEKPIAISHNEINQIDKMLKKKDLIYFSSFQKRYLPVISDTKEIIQRKIIGDLNIIRYFFGHYGPYTSYNAMSEQKWFIDSTMAGGGVLIDLGVHCIDIIRYLVGDFKEIQGYIGKTSCKNIKDEDICGVFFTCEDDIIGNITVSWCSEPMELIELIGSKGTLVIDLQSSTPFSYKPNKLEKNEILKNYLTKDYSPNSVPQHDLINHFLDCVVDKRQDNPSFLDGKRAVEFVLDAYNFNKKKIR